MGEPGGDRHHGPKDRLPRVDNAQSELFNKLLTSLTSPNNLRLSILTPENSQRLRWKPTEISRPPNSTPEPFVIRDGTTVRWRGIPTAVAVGQFANEQNLTIIGSAHREEKLRRKKINPANFKHFTRLLEGYPGSFPPGVEDCFTFWITPTETDGLKIVMGDATEKREIDISEAKLASSARSDTLGEIAGIIGQAITGKFLGEDPAGEIPRI